MFCTMASDPEFHLKCTSSPLHSSGMSMTSWNQCVDHLVSENQTVISKFYEHCSDVLFNSVTKIYS